MRLRRGCRAGGEGQCPPQIHGTPPNILILLSDDQGYDDLSSHGNTLAQTPRLDRLATQSLEFTRFYVEPACAPTRASLLTGRSFVRTGVWSVHFGGDYLALDETTFAERLRDAGYATGTWNKLRSEKTGQYEKPIAPPPECDAWFHAKIVVEARKASVFVNGAAWRSARDAAGSCGNC